MAAMESRHHFAPTFGACEDPGNFNAANDKQCGETEPVMHVSLDSWIGSYSSLAANDLLGGFNELRGPFSANPDIEAISCTFGS